MLLGLVLNGLSVVASPSPRDPVLLALLAFAGGATQASSSSRSSTPPSPTWSRRRPAAGLRPRLLGHEPGPRPGLLRGRPGPVAVPPLALPGRRRHHLPLRRGSSPGRSPRRGPPGSGTSRCCAAWRGWPGTAPPGVPGPPPGGAGRVHPVPAGAAARHGRPRGRAARLLLAHGLQLLGVVLLQPWLTPLLRKVDGSRLLATSALLFGIGYGLERRRLHPAALPPGRGLLDGGRGGGLPGRLRAGGGPRARSSCAAATRARSRWSGAWAWPSRRWSAATGDAPLGAPCPVVGVPRRRRAVAAGHLLTRRRAGAGCSTGRRDRAGPAAAPAAEAPGSRIPGPLARRGRRPSPHHYRSGMDHGRAGRRDSPRSSSAGVLLERRCPPYARALALLPAVLGRPRRRAPGRGLGPPALLRGLRAAAPPPGRAPGRRAGGGPRSPALRGLRRSLARPDSRHAPALASGARPCPRANLRALASPHRADQRDLASGGLALARRAGRGLRRRAARWRSPTSAPAPA